jgi:hypothetical protein
VTQLKFTAFKRRCSAYLPAGLVVGLVSTLSAVGCIDPRADEFVRASPGSFAERVVKLGERHEAGPKTADPDSERYALISDWHALQAELATCPIDADSLTWVQAGRFYSLGHELGLSGAQDSARNYLVRAAKILGDPEAKLALADLLLKAGQGEIQRAEALYREVLASGGGNLAKQAHQGLVFAMYYQDKGEEAWVELQRALLDDPDNEALQGLRVLFGGPTSR